MRIHTIIACLCTFGMYQLHALTTEEVIKMIDDGEQKIKKNNDDMASIKTSLASTLQSVKSQEGQIKIYIKEKNKYQKEIEVVKGKIKSELDKVFNTIKAVPTLPVVVTTAIKPLEDNYKKAMANIDAMFGSIGNLLNAGVENMATIKADLDKSINTTLPTIIQKGNETLAKLEEVRQRAPAIATYVTGVSQQVK